MNVVGKMGLVPRGIYDNTIPYDFLDFVYHNGASYVAKKLTVGHEPHENNEYWQLLAMSGIASTGIEFQESETRQNIQSGETTPTLFGKIKKWLSDLKTVALTGQYSDLEDIPNINPLEVHYPGGELDNYNWVNSDYSFVFGHSTTLSNLNIGYWVIVSIKKQTTYICLTAQGDKGIAYRFYDYNNGNPIWTDWVRGITANQVLTTKEQIDANTDTSNVAGAAAVKGLKSDLTNSISQINSDLLNKIEVVYSGLDSAESEINFSPFPFGMYIVISYRFTAIIWRWSNSLRCKIIEKEGSIELTTNKLVLEFNKTVTYICIIQCWHR